MSYFCAICSPSVSQFSTCDEDFALSAATMSPMRRQCSSDTPASWPFPVASQRARTFRQSAKGNSHSAASSARSIFSHFAAVWRDRPPSMCRVQRVASCADVVMPDASIATRRRSPNFCIRFIRFSRTSSGRVKARGIRGVPDVSRVPLFRKDRHGSPIGRGTERPFSSMRSAVMAKTFSPFADLKRTETVAQGVSACSR